MLKAGHFLSKARLVWAAALGMVLWTGCAPSGPRSLVQGERLIREGHYEQAIDKLQLATRLLPQNAQAWNFLGLAYHGARQPDKAIQAYQHALSLDRDLGAARYNLGCLFLERNNPAGATAELTTYTLLKPNVPEGWLKLGAAQVQLRQGAAAENSYNQALKINSALPEAWNGLGMAKQQRSRYKEALGDFETALRHQTNYAPALLNLAILQQQQFKNYPDALQKYREYLALKPAPPNAAGVQQLVASLESALHGTSVASSNLLLAQSTRDTNQPAFSSAPVRTAQSTNKSLSNAVAGTRHDLTSALVTQKVEIPVAPVRTNEVVSRRRSTPPPKSASVSPVASTTTNVARTVPAAPTKIEPSPALNLSPTPTQTVVVLNEPRYEPAIETGPTNTQPSAPVASAVPTRSGAAGEAKTNSAAKPPSTKVSLADRLNPGNWRRQRSRPPVPVTPLTDNPSRSLPPEPVAKPPTVSSSPVVSLPTPPSPARYEYRHPATPAPGNRVEAERHFALGLQQQKSGNWKEAMTEYELAVVSDPSYFEPRYNLAYGRQSEGQLAVALVQYELALAVNPQSFNARYNFAFALRKANYPLDAASELERLLQQAPADLRVRLLLANIYAQDLYDTEPARRHYLKLLELQPDHPQALQIRLWLAQHPPASA